MLDPVLDNATNRQIRSHFIDHVTGRGPLPAIRVGNQPYGLLLTSSFPKWAYTNRQVLERFVGKPILPGILKVLKYFDNQWRLMQWKLKSIHAGADASEVLMDVLGLHGTSVEYSQRVAYTKDHVVNLGRLKKDTLVEGANEQGRRD